MLATTAFVEARWDPVVRRTTVALPHWPSGQPPIRIVLLSDLHVGTASTDPERLARVVTLTNAQHPDLVLIAGDFLPGRDPIGHARASLMLAPLAKLTPRLGVFAVFGNHDYWTGPAVVRDELASLGVTVLDNAAREVGPIALGGVSDADTDHDRTAPVYAELRGLPGARVVFTHSPQIAPDLPLDMPLLLAGHTHCGQVNIPGFGTIDLAARRDFFDQYGRYGCGLVRDGARTTIVTAGIGTSGVPFRLGAPPDIWLITLVPAS